jgi:hypothetical protein
MKEIAIATLNYYHNTGLFIAVKQSDGTYSIVQEKLSDDQFKIASDRLNILDDNGFDKQQADYWNQRFKDDLIVPI